MSSESHYISIMKGKLRTFWTVLAGVYLTARVCDAGCIKRSFKEHITKNLLVDHWFQMKNFTPTGEEVTEQHEFFSVLNTICSSLIMNKEFITSDPDDAESQGKVMFTYIDMVKELVNRSNWTNDATVQFCSKSCSESYGISFINTTQFEKIYKKVCVQSGTLPACPSPPDTTTATIQRTTITSVSETQTSSGDGNASGYAKTCDDLTSCPIVSAVVFIIAVIIIIIAVIIVFFFTRSNKNNNNEQEPNNERPEE
ncbi:uncharacterized protein LOC125138900 isoform X2 [Tachysurus fulvidraco]|uniref:uncharacterized protein LOC125138900 isoform X2 n=1 Tax=Tachysurus fulvidraco TaxID=1234273 RepID=UPI001FEDF29F|nr:uncharacterized protein LOC125138900 isoform X2 [Tachysurus fulvidraco]XP_047657222.1 uncharacterized protein LOC125138900 isoform X2 [Tachysurus fulvidraco]